VAARSGDPTNRGHCGHRQRVATASRLYGSAGDRGPDARAGHAEAKRRDDHDRSTDARAELAADELRVPLGPPEHRRLVGQVARARDERDLDRVAAPLCFLQAAEQL
jgi:hypothetical protein